MKCEKVTLPEVLNFRELKAEIQSELLSRGGNGIIASLGMNIPGPVKSGPSIFRAFQEGIKCLEQLIASQKGNILAKVILEEKAGYAAIYFVKEIDCRKLKKDSVMLEESHFLGRLFDIDILNSSGEALTREMIGADKRTCLLCGKDAKECGRNRTHSAEELQQKVFEIIRCWEIGTKAYCALLEEVYTTPKPGLVDLYSCGAHKDMNVHTFEKSALALRPYFIRMAQQGYSLSCSEEALFCEIRKTGMQAEEAMYRATAGVNTHKGLIFTIGLYCAAAGRCIQKYGEIREEMLRTIQQKMTAEILKKELEAIKQKEAVSHGEKNIQNYGTTGIRGEAISGYPAVWEYGLSTLREGIKEKRAYNLVKIQTLFVLMSRLEDSNILARKNQDTLLEVQMQAGRFLEEGGAYAKDAGRKLMRMDAEYIDKNISAGGCADLLATAIFMEFLLDDIMTDKERMYAAGR